MFLAIDIGNTDIVFGFYETGEWRTFRLPVETSKSEEEFRKSVERLLRLVNWSLVDQIRMSSVVPVITDAVKNEVEKLSNQTVMRVGPKQYERLPIEVINPSEIGSDLVCNALSAHEKLQCDCLVIDFGTALTFTVLSAGKIQGVNIAPGLKTSMKALISNAAQLEEIPLQLPKSVIGTDTTSAIQSGILWGYVGLVERMIDRVEEELGTKLKVVATGGLSEVLEPLQKRFDEVDRNLTLEGLRLFSKYC